jgi:Spy/CpxP family protein refolding chaperone
MEKNMKKLAYVIAALATIAVAAPSIASAETVVVRHGGMHRDWHHGWHRDWHRAHDRVVVIRHRHHHDY